MIKHKIIQTEKGRLLVVNIPEGAINVKLNSKIPSGGFSISWQKVFRNGLSNYGDGSWDDNIQGNWQLLGLLSEVTEEEAKQLVEFNRDPSYLALCYKNYNNSSPVQWIASARESLHSLVEANVKLKNEYGTEPKFEDFNTGDPDDAVDDFDFEYVRWMQEEETVYHNPILFFEPK